MTDKIVNIQAPPIVGNEPTYTPVNAEVSAINITASPETPTVDGSVDVTNINVQLSGLGEESQPNDSLFRRNQDYSNISDQPRVRTGKIFIDLVTQTDTISFLANYKRTVLETKTITELKSFAIGKNLVETKSMQEDFKKNLQKVFNEAITKSDTNSKQVTKRVEESQVLTELVKLLTNKGVVETATTSDVLSRTVNYFRVFVDAVDATDDFLGLANVDDDQTARVGKNLVEYANFSDVHSLYLALTKQDTATAMDTKTLNFTKTLVDSKIVSDLVSLAYSKQQADAVTNSDTFLANIGKAVQDYTANVDTVYKQVTKAHVDYTSNQERISKSINKATNDNADATDIFSKTFTKILSDLVASADTFATAIQPAKVDEVNSSETSYRIAGKNVVEQQTTTDVLSSVVNYNRLFVDTVDATDDFLGLANVDDDQVARVGKNLIEYVSFPESLSFAAAKLFADQSSVAETFTKLYQKLLQDQTTNTDVKTLALTKPVLESVNSDDSFIRLVNYNRGPVETVDASDQSVKSVAKRLEDVATNLDVFSRVANYYRTFLDTGTTADIKYFNIGKVAQDTSTTNDTVTKSAGKVPQDQIAATESFARTVQYYRTHQDVIDATDDFFGSANIDDDQIARVGKYLTDMPETSDTLVVGSGKTLTDIGDVSDAAYKQVAKPFTDQFTRTDQLYKQPRKVQTDSVIAADVFSFNKTTNSPLTDSFSATDSGVINNQSYFAGTFATPGYVGTNTIFT
jgi:hypothetical protein